ncbi:MAG: type II toxin-antitoxin system VapC family toxin [Rhizomicrobium sp.]
MILVDTNVILDVVGTHSAWRFWSMAALEESAGGDELFIDDVVYAELASGYREMAKLDEALATLRVARAQTPKLALFLAGHAFRQYRRRGTKTGVLPDFFIGAHAFVSGAAVLTRDRGFIETYFPTVTLVSP